jgi:excisionase family DNA binding protein
MKGPDLLDVLKEIRALREEVRASRAKLLTVEETAKRLSVAPKTVRNKLSTGAFPIKPVRSLGGVRFKAADVEAYIEGLRGWL